MRTALEPRPTPPLVRIRLAPRGPLPRRIDGAWWPHTHDLTTELPLLLAVLPRSWGEITIVTVNSAMWSAIPRRIQVGDHVVRLGAAAVQHAPPTICLVSPGHGRWDLLVVPPETPESAAESLMVSAAEP